MCYEFLCHSVFMYLNFASMFACVHALNISFFFFFLRVISKIHTFMLWHIGQFINFSSAA